MLKEGFETMGNLVKIESAKQCVAGHSKRFAKIVVVNPPSPPGCVANRESHGGYGQLYPVGAPVPIALDIPYLVGNISAKLLPLEVVEAQGLALARDQVAARVAEIARGYSPERVFVVVRVALCCLDWDLSVCGAIKEAWPDASLAVYGAIIPEIQNRVEQEAFLDYIIRGEPDETVVELFEGCLEENVLGLHYRRGGAWVDNPSRPLIKDLDSLPFPKWELLPYRRYTLPRSSTTVPVPFLPMLTSRGCPFGCHYCPYPVTEGLPFRYRSAQNVVNEIEHLIKDLGIQYIIFRDPMFSLRQDRVVEICKEIVTRKLAIRWKCETRIDCLNETTLRAMAAAGCEGINFGIESAEVEIQANVGRKPITQDDITRTVALCRELRIKTFCFFIVGLPGDTAETILSTIAFALRLRPTWVQFNAASPLIGTKLRKWAVSRGLTPDDDYSYRTSHEAMIGNENLTKGQIAKLQRFASFFERYLMNRGGILKDESRNDFLYSSVRLVVDWFASLSARIIFAVGRSCFARAYVVTPPPERSLP
jgi:hypothetical protein